MYNTIRDMKTRLSKYVHVFMCTGVPTLILGGGFRRSVAIGLTLTGWLTLSRDDSATAAVFVGWYVPSSRDGVSVSIWPLVFTFTKD